MKTVIEAVNLLEANLNCLERGFRDGYKTIIINKKTGQIVGSIGIKSDYEVCSVEEFNACVDELSAATWIDGASLEEWKAGMKNTVIDSHGNELELNKIYEFSDHGIEWKAAILLGLVDDEVEYLSSDSGWSMFIRECQSPLGTIKKAPVKLVDKGIYQFTCSGSDWIGIYIESRKSFFEVAKYANKICGAGEAINIVRLVPETK